MKNKHQILFAGTTVIALCAAGSAFAGNHTPAETDTPGRILQEAYPSLPSAALTYAHLQELPEGILLRTDDITITSDDLAREINEVPAQMREQMRKNQFGMLENMITEKLLRKAAGLEADEDLRQLQAYFEKISAGATVSDGEVRAFYENNRDMVGGAPYDQIKPRIEQHLIQQQKQVAVEKHVKELGKKYSIAVDTAWTEEQAKQAMDNPVDKARASGKPTFASFGADACMPCQMMKPFREEIEKEYGDNLNVVYIHVNKDQALSSRYGVRGIPHVIFFSADGQQIHDQSGFMSKEQIVEWLDKMGVERPDGQ